MAYVPLLRQMLTGMCKAKLERGGGGSWGGVEGRGGKREGRKGARELVCVCVCVL